MKKETTDQSLSGSCCTTNAASTVGGTTSNTMYCQTTYGNIKTKTKTIDIYKINKKGKEVLVGRNVITTTKTKYPEIVPNYTLTSTPPIVPPYVVTCDVPTVNAYPNVVTAPTVQYYPNGTNVSYTTNESRNK